MLEHPLIKKLSHGIEYFQIKTAPLYPLGAMFVLVNFILLGIWYSTSYVFMDGEPSVAIVSYFFLKGKEIYPSLNSPFVISLPNGPMLYIFHSIFFKLLGVNLLSAKIGGAVASISSLGLFFIALRQRISNRLSLLVTGYMALILIQFMPFPFWSRPDPYVIFFVALALGVATHPTSYVAWPLTGLALGMSIALRLSSGIYFVPILALLWNHHGSPRVALALISGLAWSFTPFLLFSNLSLENYFSAMSLIAKGGLRGQVLIENAVFFFKSLFLPVLCGLFFQTSSVKFMRQLICDNKLYVGALMVSTIGTAFICSKPGSDPNHLISLVFLYGYLFCLIGENKEIRKSALVVIPMGAVLAGLVFFLLVSDFITVPKGKGYDQFTRSAKMDLKEIMKRYPDASIEMGCVNMNKINYVLTYLRPLLVFSGHPYFVDPHSLMDRELGGRGFPQQATVRFKKRLTDIILIPVGGKPFDLISPYTGRPLFPREFIEAFYQNYYPVGQSNFYVIWKSKS